MDGQRDFCERSVECVADDGVSLDVLINGVLFMLMRAVQIQNHPPSTSSLVTGWDDTTSLKVAKGLPDDVVGLLKRSASPSPQRNALHYSRFSKDAFVCRSRSNPISNPTFNKATNNNNDNNKQSTSPTMSINSSSSRRVQALLSHVTLTENESDSSSSSRSETTLTRSATGANEGVVPTNLAALPLPPLRDMEGMFPTFPQMLEDAKHFRAGLVSYKIMGGRRMTVIQDPELYEVIFSPHEMGMTPGVGDAVQVEMAKLVSLFFSPRASSRAPRFCKPTSPHTTNPHPHPHTTNPHLENQTK